MVGCFNSPHLGRLRSPGETWNYEVITIYPILETFCLSFWGVVYNTINILYIMYIYIYTSDGLHPMASASSSAICHLASANFSLLPGGQPATDIARPCWGIPLSAHPLETCAILGELPPLCIATIIPTEEPSP